MRAFRIADQRCPIFDGTGARLAGGRWNSPGRPVIYAAETFAGAMLEILVRSDLQRIPRTYVHTEISMPSDISMEILGVSQVPGWYEEGEAASRRFGNRWLEEGRSAILVVPSLAAGGVESNVLMNPLHADFGRISAGEPRPVVWDSRLFLRK